MQQRLQSLRSSLALQAALALRPTHTLQVLQETLHRLQALQPAATLQGLQSLRAAAALQRPQALQAAATLQKLQALQAAAALDHHRLPPASLSTSPQPCPFPTYRSPPSHPALRTTFALAP